MSNDNASSTDAEVVLSVDVEWAHPAVLEDVVAALDERGLRATFFCTHEGIRSRGTSGRSTRTSGDTPTRISTARPLPIPSSTSSAGSSSGCARFCPEAVGVRAHSLFHESGLLSVYRAAGLDYDSSAFLPLVPGGAPFLRGMGIVELPLYYMDHWDLVEQATGFELSRASPRLSGPQGCRLPPEPRLPERGDGAGLSRLEGALSRSRLAAPPPPAGSGRPNAVPRAARPPGGRGTPPTLADVNARFRGGAAVEGRDVRLSELAEVVPLDVVRDAEFESLGLLLHETPALLACLYDPKARRRCAANEAVSCVIAGSDLSSAVPARLGLALAGAPREAFLDAHRHLGSETDFYGEDFSSEVASEASISPSAHVAERRVRIAAGCVVEPGAVVLEGSTLAEDVVVRAGAVVGAEGFHPVPYGVGLVNMPHYGSVRLGRGVEVGANAVVCRSVFADPTEVGEAAILGPLVYVAHGVRIGPRSRLAASARVAGSARLGEEVFVGPGAVVRTPWPSATALASRSVPSSPATSRRARPSRATSRSTTNASSLPGDGSSSSTRQAMIAPDVSWAKAWSIQHPELVNLYGCAIGDESRIGPFVEIQAGAAIGRRCKLSSHTFRLYGGYDRR